jgi:cytochrome c oxidase subunit 2
VVPVDKKIRVITTANDVIHAFMVPAGINQDAIPGFVRDTWFKAEESGISMDSAQNYAEKNTRTAIHVKVLSAADYTAWVAVKPRKRLKADDPAKVWELVDLKVRGEKVYAANCVACHQATGKGAELRSRRWTVRRSWLMRTTTNK